MIPAILISFALIFVQVCAFPGLDLADVGSWGIGAVALAGMAYLVARNRIGAGSIILGLPLVYMILVSLQRWVPGFTEYQIAWYVIGWGLILLAARGDVKVIMWALLAGIVIQAAIQHFSLIQWGQHFADAKDDIWGSFRHRIRYSTWIFAGVVAAWYLWKHTRGWQRWAVLGVGCFGLFEIGRAHSNTIIALAFLTVCVFLAMHVCWRTAITVFLAGVLIALVAGVDGFRFEDIANANGRVGIWLSCLKGDFSPWWKAIIGHGAGAWTLDCGTMGWQSLRHPHNELLHIAYEYGILAVWWTIGLCLLAVWIAPDLILKIGVAFMLTSMLTNSASTYPEQFLLSCTFLGVGLSDVIKASDCKMCVTDGCSDNCYDYSLCVV